MRCRFTAMIAVTALAVGAGAGGTGVAGAVPDPGGAGRAAAVFPRQPGTATGVAHHIPRSQLSEALLHPGELPRGFRNHGPFIDGYTFGGCPALQRILDARTAFPAHAEANFAKGILGPFVVESIASGSEAQARTVMTDAGVVTSTCRSFSGTNGSGKAVAHQITPLPMPRLGDATQGMRLRARRGVVSVVGDMVVIRRGGVVIVVVNAVPAGTPDGAVTQKVARSALQKLDDRT